MAFSEFYISDDHPMYVQHYGAAAASSSAVLVHGGVHTGVCWTTRPDGRPCWAPYLAERGWAVYVVDWPGVGRSGGVGSLLQSRAEHIVSALADLLRAVGPSLLVGHSIGAALAAKVMEVAREHTTGLISIAPAPHGNVVRPETPVPRPEDQPIIFDEAPMQHFFCNAPRFPKGAIDQYRRSLCAMSPSVFNALGPGNASQALAIDHIGRLASIPKLVVAGDHDQLVTAQMSSAVAQSLGAPHVTVGKDWGLPGFGHMIPIEDGSEEVLDRCLDWFAQAAGWLAEDPLTDLSKEMTRG
jgi:pimeloyl-ACP methyl ester carboxylesterase